MGECALAEGVKEVADGIGCFPNNFGQCLQKYFPIPLVFFGGIAGHFGCDLQYLQSPPRGGVGHREVKTL